MQIINKKARFIYNLFERIEVGVSLIGGEVKAIRNGSADLSNSYAKIVSNELFLVNANIPIAGKKDYNSTRTRKLLIHKKELVSLQSTIKAKKLTLVPTKLYTKRHLIKIEVALAKSKREFEKKEVKKKRDIEREIEAELKIKSKF